MEVLELSDLHSATWMKLRKHFEARLAELREQNDAKRLTDAETAFLRGQIFAMKEALGLSETTPVPLKPVTAEAVHGI